MTETKSLIGKLQKHSFLVNSPCSDSQLDALKNKLGVDAIEDISELFNHHDGMKPSQVFPLRLMSFSELIETEKHFVDWLSNFEKDIFDANKILLLWTDDNSNYAGIYLTGKLKGTICFVSHDEIDLTPVFRNIFSFYESLFEVAEKNSYLIESNSDDYLIDWYDMKTDFPNLSSSKIYDEIDSELANHFIKLFEFEQDADKKAYFAFCAMNLFPFEQTEKIITFTESKDMWIQERACQILGQKHYEKAIPILINIAKNGMQNGRVASMCALRKFGTEEAETAIENLFNEVEDGYKIYLKPKVTFR